VKLFVIHYALVGTLLIASLGTQAMEKDENKKGIKRLLMGGSTPPSGTSTPLSSESLSSEHSKSGHSKSESKKNKNKKKEKGKKGSVTFRPITMATKQQLEEEEQQKRINEYKTDIEREEERLGRLGEELKTLISIQLYIKDDGCIDGRGKGLDTCKGFHDHYPIIRDGWHHIRMLFLDDNRLHYLSLPIILTYCTKLEILSACYNQIKKVEFCNPLLKEPQDFSTLKRIDLSNNKIKDGKRIVALIKQCPGLRKINVINNLFEEEKHNILKGVTKYLANRYPASYQLERMLTTTYIIEKNQEYTVFRFPKAAGEEPLRLLL
jgi:hypothetical protein